MNGLSIVLKYFIKLCCAAYRKLGINGILIIAIAVTIPASALHLNTTQSDYKYSTNYTVTAASDPEKAAQKDIPLSVDRFGDDYYKVRLQITNSYSTEIYPLPSLSAKNKENYVSLHELDYYSDIDDYDVISPDTCIPAGTSVTIPYYITGYDLDGARISIAPFDEDEANDKNSLSIHLPKDPTP